MPQPQSNSEALQWPLCVLAIFFLVIGATTPSITCLIFGAISGGSFYLIYQKNKKENSGVPKILPKLILPDFKSRNFQIIKKMLTGPLLMVSFFLMFIGFIGNSNGGVILGFLGFCGFCLFLYWAFNKPKTDNKPLNSGDTTHGSAAWSPMPDVLNAFYNSDTGHWIGGGFRRKNSGHLLTVAGAGQGKGTCQIIPTMLSEPCGSYVVTDPKGEIAFITARFQKNAGQDLYILDPWGEQSALGAKHGISSAGFNPFEFIKHNLDELRDNCDQIAYFLVPDIAEVKDPFWNDRARNLIKTLLMHIITNRPENEQNFWTLYKMLRLSGEDWIKLLAEMKLNNALDGLISISAQELIGLETAANTMTGIKSAAQNATSIFESPQLRASLEKNEFNPYDLTNGKTTVYVVIPERYLDTHATYLRLVIGLCLKACNSRPNKRVNFMLDEFAVMGKMRDVQRGYAFARGQNIVLWAFVQSLSQLKELYGDDGMNTFVSNAAVFQAFGVKDNFTTEYVSKLLGESTITKITESYNTADEMGGINLSYDTHGRRLLTPDEVERCPYIITIAGGLRMQLTRMPYFGANVPIAPKNWTGFDDKTAQELDKRYFDLEKAVVEFNSRADEPPRLIS